MMRNVHITAAIAHERERELRQAAEAARASAQPVDERSEMPVRRRLMERLVRREERACTPEHARSAS
jgi:hypothetical protein